MTFPAQKIPCLHLWIGGDNFKRTVRQKTEIRRLDLKSFATFIANLHFHAITKAVEKLNMCFKYSLFYAGFHFCNSNGMFWKLRCALTFSHCHFLFVFLSVSFSPTSSSCSRNFSCHLYSSIIQSIECSKCMNSILKYFDMVDRSSSFFRPFQHFIYFISIDDSKGGDIGRGGGGDVWKIPFRLDKHNAYNLQHVLFFA